MKMQRLTAALTAATVAFASLSATLPTVAFAETVTKTISYDPKFSTSIETTEAGWMGTEEPFKILADDAEQPEEVKSQLPAEYVADSLRISNATLTYTITGADSDFQLDVWGGGWNAAGEYIEQPEGSDPIGTKYEGIAKSGTISTADKVFTDGTETIKDFGWIDVYGGGTVAAAGTLTFAVTNVELDVTYAVTKSCNVTGNKTYTFDDQHLLGAIGGQSTIKVGNVNYETFTDQFIVGDWLDSPDVPEGLSGIKTVSGLVAAYNAMELKFRASDISGPAEAYALLQVGDESKGEYQEIALAAQDIKEGQNVYTANFGTAIETEYDTLQSISVHIRAKNVGETVTMKLSTYDSKTVSATGSKVFESESLDESRKITLAIPGDWTTKYEGDFGVWYYDSEPASCPETKVSELYKNYKGGKIAFNVSGYNESADVDLTVMLQTKTPSGDYGEDIPLYTGKFKNGLNTLEFDLPAITYTYDDIWGINVRLSADAATTFVVSDKDLVSISATGTKVFDSEPLEKYREVSLEIPAEWQPDWTTKYEASLDIWYYDADPDPRPAATIPDLYKNYKGGKITFNVDGLNKAVTWTAMLQTKTASGDYGVEIPLASGSLKNGTNTLEFDLPEITYASPDIWGMYVRFNADEAAEFVVMDKDSASISATGTEVFKSEPYEEYGDYDIVTPDWWDPADGEYYEIAMDIWNYGAGAYEDNRLAKTVEELYTKYKGGEISFNVIGLKDDVTYTIVLQTKTGDNYGQEFDISETKKLQNGLNTVKFDLPKINYVDKEIWGITVRFNANKKTTVTAANSEYKTIKATGSDMFEVEFDGENVAVSIEKPEWWDTAWGELYEGGIGVCYFGMGEEPNTCPADTIPDLYGKFKSGEITFNVSDLNADVEYKIEVQTRSGNNFKDPIVLSNGKLRNGSNTIKFDLPEIMYKYPDIWGIYVRMSAAKATSFTVNKTSTPSNPSTPSTPSTSETTSSDTTSSETKEEFKTEDKPLADIMEEVKPDTTASIEVAPEDTTVKADVFEAAKEKNVTLELKLDNGVKWEIKADTISGGAADVNISVELNTSNVPAESVESVAAGKTTMQISLAHEGSFGFEAAITIPVAPANNGKFANLFHFNNGAMEFVASVMVSGGEAKLPFSHASEYVIVFDEKSMGTTDSGSESTSSGTSDSASVSNSTPETNNNNPVTGTAGVGAFAALTAAAAATVVILRKRNRK